MLNNSIMSRFAQSVTTGLSPSPGQVSSYIEHGLGWTSTPAITTSSNTATSAGGAPGATFGVQGNAPTPSDLVLPSVGTMVVIAIVAFAAWKVLRS